MEEAPERIIQISAGASTDDFLALSNRGLIYRYSAAAHLAEPMAGPPPDTGQWTMLPLPAGFGPVGERLIDPVDNGGRMHKGYELCKDNRTKMFYWERTTDNFQSEPFERMDEAIAASHTDYMIRHRPKTSKP